MTENAVDTAVAIAKGVGKAAAAQIAPKTTAILKQTKALAEGLLPEEEEEKKKREKERKAAGELFGYEL